MRITSKELVDFGNVVDIVKKVGLEVNAFIIFVLFPYNWRWSVHRNLFCVCQSHSLQL